MAFKRGSELPSSIFGVGLFFSLQAESLPDVARYKGTAITPCQTQYSTITSPMIERTAPT